jgi:hypothetical protein
MNGKYSYHPFSFKIVNLSILNGKIGVKVDFLIRYLYIRIIWGPLSNEEFVISLELTKLSLKEDLNSW